MAKVEIRNPVSGPGSGAIARQLQETGFLGYPNLIGKFQRETRFRVLGVGAIACQSRETGLERYRLIKALKLK
ncbi:MAG: hypothetical protein AB4352_13290 [Hormoscilla sp.]